MPKHVRPGRVALAAALVAVLTSVLPSAADAARPKAVHQHGQAFAAHGLVLRHTGSSVTLLASAVKSGKHRARNTTVTVALPSRRTAAGRALAKRLARTSAGDGIAVTGRVAGGRVTAKNFAARPAPFHAYLGTVSKVDGNLVTLAKAGDPSDDPREPGHGAFTVDTAAATISVDGTPAAAGNLTVGETAAVLGSSVDDVVAATSVFAFTAAPDVVSGQVTAVDAPLLTVAGRGEDSRHDGHGGDGRTPVSLDSATLIVDGASDAPITAVTVSARILALGVDQSDGTFDAALAFVFTHGCSSRHHGDGGQGSDDGD